MMKVVAKFGPTTNAAAKKRAINAALAFAVTSVFAVLASACFAEDGASPPPLNTLPAWYQPNAGFANWSLSVGEMLIRRTESNNYVLTVDGANNPIGPRSADLRGLGSVGAILDLQGDWRGVGLELRGMFVGPNASSGAYSDTNGMGASYARGANAFGIFPLGFTTPVNGTTTRSTQFGSAEANIGTSVAPPLRAFVGVRYFATTDNIDYAFAAPKFALSDSMTTAARNSMVGPQVGVEGTLRKFAGLPVDLSLTAKAATLKDSAFGSMQQFFPPPSPAQMGSATASSWVPMGELAFDAIWHALPKMDFSVGYDVISLGPVATAPATQYYSTFPSVTAAAHDKQLYQGATLQSILRF